MLTPWGRQSGFSLVELMVAMSIGVIVFAWMSDYLTQALTDHTITLQRNLLNQAFQSSLDSMGRELRRAGYWGDAYTNLKHGANNPFANTPFTPTTGSLPGEEANSCITFSYDLNDNGVMETDTSDERFGFRLNQGVVEMRLSGDAPFDCAHGDWDPMTSDVMVVDTLEFTLQVTSCLNITRSGADCTTTAAVKDDLLLRQHQVTITMDGHMKRKPDLQRHDSLTVLVRNPMAERTP